MRASAVHVSLAATSLTASGAEVRALMAEGGPRVLLDYACGPRLRTRQPSAQAGTERSREDGEGGGGDGEREGERGSRDKSG